MGKRVFIAGGGIAGMTAAMLLAEQGFDVVLCERSEKLGGKCRSGRTPEGNPTEHSLRIYSSSYVTLLPLLARIPAGEGRTVLDNLIPVSFHSVLSEGTLVKSSRGQLAARRQGFLRRLLTRLSLPLLVFLRALLVPMVFAWKFRRAGVSVRESLSYMFKHLRLLWMCPARVEEELGNISYSDYLALENATPAARQYFFGMPQIVVAARPDAEAKSLALMMMRTYFNPQIPARGLEQMNFPRWMMDGPTSEKFLEPWTEHLRRLKVHILQGTVTDLKVEEGLVRRVVLDDGRSFEADHFILALPYVAYQHLFRKTALGGAVPDPDRSPLRLEWSNGIQIFLRELPSHLSEHFTPGVVCLHLDSPWMFASVLQGPGLWRGVQLPAGTQYILSATWSEVSVPGKVTGKSMTACTPDEILTEALSQCGFYAREVIVGWQVDEQLGFFSEEEYQKCQHALPPHLAAEPTEGRRTVTFSPLAVRLPGPVGQGPQTHTAIPNLFLAGEFVRTRSGIPTMEKAVASGTNAASAVAGRYGIILPDANSEDALSRATAFHFLRRVDGWFFRRRKAARTSASKKALTNT